MPTIEDWVNEKVFNKICKTDYHVFNGRGTSFRVGMDGVDGDDTFLVFISSTKRSWFAGLATQVFVGYPSECAFSETVGEYDSEVAMLLQLEEDEYLVAEGRDIVRFKHPHQIVRYVANDGIWKGERKPKGYAVDEKGNVIIPLENCFWQPTPKQLSLLLAEPASTRAIPHDFIDTTETTEIMDFKKITE